MPSNMTVLIPMKSYLKKYLISIYGAEPIEFPHRHQYNTFLIRRLSRPPVDFKPTFDRENCIEIVLPFNHLVDVNYKFHLSIRDCASFRKEIDREFMYDYICVIQEFMKQGYNRIQATTLCMAVYNIVDEDISFDAFYKNFYRKWKIRFEPMKKFEIFPAQTPVSSKDTAVL